MNKTKKRGQEEEKKGEEEEEKLIESMKHKNDNDENTFFSISTL